MEEAARQWIATCTDQEQGWVPRERWPGRESWLGLMWEVESLRRGAVFGRSHGSITLSENGALATKATFGNRAAASKATMRAGCHYVQFTVMRGYMYLGVIRPGWDVDRGRAAGVVCGWALLLRHGQRAPLPPTLPLGGEKDRGGRGRPHWPAPRS